MRNLIGREIRPAIVLLLLFTILTGIVYPVAVTVFARTVFPYRAGGSLIERGDVVVGSELISQSFTKPGYFWPRPSAAAYNGASSSGSNMAPSNPALVEAVKGRVKDIHTSDTLNLTPIPPDMVLTSASGLDPHISVDSARWQAARVALDRQISEETVAELIRQNTAPRALGVFGEAGVNVLTLNLALDNLNRGAK